MLIYVAVWLDCWAILVVGLLVFVYDVLRCVLFMLSDVVCILVVCWWRLFCACCGVGCCLLFGLAVDFGLWVLDWLACGCLVVWILGFRLVGVVAVDYCLLYLQFVCLLWCCLFGLLWVCGLCWVCLLFVGCCVNCCLGGCMLV